MKTKFFRNNVATRLIVFVLLLCPTMLPAQSVSNLSVGAGTVTFNVTWKLNEVSGGKVWVFVDYNRNGVMVRLPVIGGSVTGSGTVEKVNGNTDGMWVNGGASFSGTVTLSFNSQIVVNGACAYASGYPPKAEYSAAQTIKFTGTPPYNLVLSSGGTATAYDYYNLLPGVMLASFTDKTGAPGITPPSTPPHAASTQTWVITGNGITQTWSNLIEIPDCKNQTFSSSNTDPKCRTYRYPESGDELYYYYNWHYVNANKDIICPVPWRVPNVSDFLALDLALGGDGSDRDVDPDWITKNYVTRWGATYAGFVDNADNVAVVGITLYMWSSTDTITNQPYLLELGSAHVKPMRSAGPGFSFSVRCVR